MIQFRMLSRWRNRFVKGPSAIGILPLASGEMGNIGKMDGAV
jgi:hypothetical protein